MNLPKSFQVVLSIESVREVDILQFTDRKMGSCHSVRLRKVVHLFVYAILDTKYREKNTSYEGHHNRKKKKKRISTMKANIT